MSHRFAAISAMAVVASATSAQISFSVTITADNQYGLSTGALSSADGYVGGGMGPNANWTWYDSGRDPRPDAPYQGFNHDEYLIFRLPVNIPAASGAALLAAIPLAAGRRR